MSSQPLSYSAHERVLCLSNGHGEDVIAARILEALQQLPDAPKLAALPLVGEGRAYHQIGIPVIGSVKTMPSGGFIYMDGRQFARDLQGGLLQLTIDQFRTIRRWAKQGGSILAVGDIVPLLLAYLSGIPYAFVGTAKSEYYLRDENGRLFPHTFIDGWSGSVYYPWERWLMSRIQCQAVFPRDSLTTKTLLKWAIPAFDLGNPMMDGLEPELARSVQQEPVVAGGSWPRRQEAAIALSSPSAYRFSGWGNGTSPEGRFVDALKVVLLPGSRAPEAYDNWKRIVAAVEGLIQQMPDRPLKLFAAVAASLSLEPLSYWLQTQGWQAQAALPLSEYSIRSLPDPQAQYFTRQQATLVLTQHAFADCLHQADWAIAMAGTATEQFVGLGKPAIIIPGRGPQFTPQFAEAQTRLLGQSVVLVENPDDVAIAIQTLQNQPERLQQIAQNGCRRMGKPGAASRIAECLMQQFRALA